MRKDLVVFRCENCIKDLQEHNPYVYPNGKTIPLKRIEAIEVDRKHCENNEENISHKPQLCTSIRINRKEKNPWIVKFWETEYDREDGMAEIFGRYETFNEAYNEGIRSARLNDWACCEILLKAKDEEQYAVYTYATTDPKADEFVV